MKHRWAFSPKVRVAKITKPICGNTAGPAEWWCSTSAWVGNGKVPGVFWATLRASSKVGGPNVVHAACWAHARRKVFQAVELNPKDQSAICIVAQIDELFGIDAQARNQGLSLEDRQLSRLDKSKPLLEQIKTQIQTARRDALPKSVLAKACNTTP